MMTNKRPAYAGRNLRQSVKCLRAIEAGAIGIIWVRNDGGLLIESGALGWGGLAPIPGVSVSREVGHTLARVVRGKTNRVRISMQNSIEPSTGWNLVGELPGANAGGSQNDQMIVAGAHYDSEDNTTGAMDNGVGTLVMLEAARALVNHPGAIGKNSLRLLLGGGNGAGRVGALCKIASIRTEQYRVHAQSRWTR